MFIIIIFVICRPEYPSYFLRVPPICRVVADNSPPKFEWVISILGLKETLIDEVRFHNSSFCVRQFFIVPDHIFGPFLRHSVVWNSSHSILIPVIFYFSMICDQTDESLGFHLLTYSSSVIHMLGCSSPITALAYLQQFATIHTLLLLSSHSWSCSQPCSINFSLVAAVSIVSRIPEHLNISFLKKVIQQVLIFRGQTWLHRHILLRPPPFL